MLKNEKNTEIKVSVIIPCYNHGEFILDAISSVQKCQNAIYEIIIVNDGSTETLTQKVVDYLRENNYQVIAQSNQGLAAARNTGIEMAKGQYILPLDADNKIRSDYLTKAIDILDKYPEVGVVYGNPELFGDKTGVVDVPEFDLNRIVMGNYIDACAVFRKIVWQECGGYDTKIPDKLGYEDWDLWLSAAEKGWKFYHIPEVLFDYRVRAESMVSFCNIPENRKQLLRYISTKHIGLYATNFANIWAERESAFLTQKAYAENLQTQLKQTKDELEKVRSHGLQTQAQLRSELVKTQSQLQETQTELQAEMERSHIQLQQTETQLEQTQTQLQNLQIELAHQRALQQQTYVQLQLKVAELTERQEQLEQTKAKLQQMQQMQQQMQQSKAQMEGELANLQEQLQQTQAQLQQSEGTIAAMQTTKFWKLRTKWFKLKKAIGLKRDA